MWDGKTLSVVLMTYAERDSIRQVIEGFFETGVVDEVLVVNNNAQEGEAVLGTRTTRELIWSGANMGWFLKWGNWAVAKLVELLFNTTHLSDMGCTFRLFNRRMADYVAETMKIGESHAGAEIMMLVIVSGARFVEIPVNYLPRVGKSSVTGDPLKAFVLGLKVLAVVIGFRLRAPRRLPRPEPFETDSVSVTSSRD
jgi:hypothetical protein